MLQVRIIHTTGCQQLSWSSMGDLGLMACVISRGSRVRIWMVVPFLLLMRTCRTSKDASGACQDMIIDLEARYCFVLLALGAMCVSFG